MKTETVGVFEGIVIDHRYEVTVLEIGEQSVRVAFTDKQNPAVFEVKTLTWNRQQEPAEELLQLN